MRSRPSVGVREAILVLVLADRVDHNIAESLLS